MQAECDCIPFSLLGLCVGRFLHFTLTPAVLPYYYSDRIESLQSTHLSTSMMNGLGFCRTVCSGRAPMNLRFFKIVHAENMYNDYERRLLSEGLNNIPLERSMLYLSSSPSIASVKRKFFIIDLSFKKSSCEG